jgi:hypothetical protein
MKLRTFLFLSLLPLFIFGNEQRNNPPSISKTSADPIEIGSLVSELSKELWCVFQDKRNNIWFGSNGEGVYRYDGKNLLNFTTKDGLCSDSIRQIQEDEFGNIFFSTLNGINKFDGIKITSLQAIKSTDWKLEATDLWFFMLGKKGEHGPYRYDGENLYSLQFPKHFLHDEILEKGINPFFSPYEIYTIYKDREGYMWFGTSIFGACRFDGKSIKWLYEKDLTIVPNGGSFGIRSIFENRDGSFWFCNTLHTYVFDFDKTAKSDRLQYRKTKGIGDEHIFDGDPYIYYSHIVEDETGAIWMSTWSKGVYKYDGIHITHYSVQAEEKEINLVSIYKDKQGGLWLGTAKNGVFKFNGESFEQFKM